jgi:hypothetical protein
MRTSRIEAERSSRREHEPEKASSSAQPRGTFKANPGRVRTVSDYLEAINASLSTLHFRLAPQCAHCFPLDPFSRSISTFPIKINGILWLRPLIPISYQSWSSQGVKGFASFRNKNMTRVEALSRVAANFPSAISGRRAAGLCFLQGFLQADGFPPHPDVVRKVSAGAFRGFVFRFRVDGTRDRDHSVPDGRRDGARAANDICDLIPKWVGR